MPLDPAAQGPLSRKEFLRHAGRRALGWARSAFESLYPLQKDTAAEPARRLRPDQRFKELPAAPRRPGGGSGGDAA